MPAALHMEVLDGGEAELAISDADPQDTNLAPQENQALPAGASERGVLKLPVSFVVSIPTTYLLTYYYYILLTYLLQVSKVDSI